MKRSLCVGVAMALVAVAAPREASGQGIFVGGGVTIPTSDFGDASNTGWTTFAGVLSPVGDQGLSIGAEGFFGSNGSVLEGDKYNLYGALALAGLSFGGETAAASPFVFGGLGFLSAAYKSETLPEETNSGMALGGGAGVNFPLGGAQGMIAGNYLHGFGDVDGFALFGIGAAVQFIIGG